MTYGLFVNGRVLRADRGFVEGAVLHRDGVIVDVFDRRPPDGVADREDVKVTDLRGRFLIPGFVDGHNHLLAIALKHLRCDLSSAGSADEVVEQLRSYATRRSDDAPLVGVEWDESTWLYQDFPTREQLDAISTTRPVMARRICCHAAVANTPFLDLLDAPDAFVNRDTGVITEGAVARATQLSYPPRELIVEAMTPAVRSVHALGVTGIHDIIEEKNFSAYVQGLVECPSPLRIDGYFHVAPERFAEVVAPAAALGDFFRPVGIKIFTDGSIGARTAALHEAYTGTDERGMLLVERERLREMLAGCVERHIACAVHAIGDRALAMVLEGMRDAGDGMFRVEHAELIGPAEHRLLEGSRVTLAMQPNFVRNWAGEGGLYERRVGKTRTLESNPFATLTRAGVEYFFSSDGMPTGPLYGLKGATRHPNPAERIDPAQALGRYTEGPNRFGPAPRRIGRIEPEFAADFAVLTGNPLIADTDGIRVESTWVAGTEVFRRG